MFDQYTTRMNYTLLTTIFFQTRPNLSATIDSSTINSKYFWVINWPLHKPKSSATKVIINKIENNNLHHLDGRISSLILKAINQQHNNLNNT